LELWRDIVGLGDQLVIKPTLLLDRQQSNIDIANRFQNHCILELAKIGVGGSRESDGSTMVIPRRQ
jgi:hypothetical protein